MDDSIPAPIPLNATDSDVSPSPEDSIPATIPLTTANFDSGPAPPVLNLTYIVIIDSGSSSSRIFIYKIPGADNKAKNRRLGVGRLFGPHVTTAQVPSCGKLQHLPSPIRIIDAIFFSGSGIHCARTGPQMRAHLNPILRWANQHLVTLGATRQNTAIYLLATGGMRSLAVDDYDNVLRRARAVIQGFPSPCFTYHPTNIRTITGQQEGLFAWIYQNYGWDRVGGPRGGSLEMGGASVQYAYTVPRDAPIPPNRIVSICSNPDNRTFRQDVYSQSWEGLGSNSLNDDLVQLLSETNCPNQRCNNPCLPNGMPYTRNDVRTVGTGDFAACFAFASSKHKDQGLPTLAPLGNDTEVFRAISSFYWTHRFFNTSHAFYNADKFEAAVQIYCGDNWNGTNPDEYTPTMCLNAAWMLVSFEGAAKSIFFTNGVAWTHGAAALIANHAGLKLCPGTNESELEQFYPNSRPRDGIINASSVHIPQTLSLPAPVQLHAAPVTGTPSVTLWAYLPFAVALMFISRFLVRRSRAKAYGKIHLPDLEENTPSVGAKGDMQDLAGSVLRSEGFYKD